MAATVQRAIGSGYSAISAAYLVLNTPDSRRSIALHPLDPTPAENARWPEHQGDYHDHVGREVLGAAAHIGIEVAGGEALDQADDEAAHDSTDHGVEAAEDDHGKHLQADQRQVHVNTEHAAPDHAAECRDDAGHPPPHCQIPLPIDT